MKDASKFHTPTAEGEAKANWSFFNSMEVFMVEAYNPESKMCEKIFNRVTVKTRIRHSVVVYKPLDIQYHAPWMNCVGKNGLIVRMVLNLNDYRIAIFWDDHTKLYLGTAEIVGNACQLACTPEQREALKDAIRKQKNQL